MLQLFIITVDVNSKNKFVNFKGLCFQRHENCRSKLMNNIFKYVFMVFIKLIQLNESFFNKTFEKIIYFFGFIYLKKFKFHKTSSD